MTPQDRPDARAVIVGGRAVLGIELGSTRIKAVLVDPDGNKIASGGHAWENQFVDRTWTYSQDAIWSGVQACFESLRHDTERKYAVQPITFGGLGISAMMHGYLAFDKQGELLVPFRTWRNTSTEQAASELTDLFGYNIP
ncbi:MAG TPA: FGGY family carbohydrate kinase, partial [Dermatophilaceae bacterium]